MRFAALLAALLACSNRRPTAPPSPVASIEPSSTATATATPIADAAVALPPVPDDAEAGPQAPAPPKVVLHTGDSLVGGYGGLTKALEEKFKNLGAKFVRDTRESVGISVFDRDPKFAAALKKYDPDVVILTLGANDVFVPFPQALAQNVASIAKKMDGRTCYWMAPALWKPDTGILEVIQKSSAPCKYFDGRGLKIPRGGDGIHPTDKGGALWADRFWDFYLSGRSGRETSSSYTAP